MNRARFLADILLFVLALFGPWWLVLSLVLVGSVYFKDFVEGLAVLFWIDLYYGSNVAGWLSYFPLTIIFILWWALVEWLRDVLI